MNHRHLTHEAFTLAAIEDILERGSMPDWAPLLYAIEADPYGEVAEKALQHLYDARYLRSIEIVQPLDPKRSSAAGRSHKPRQ